MTGRDILEILDTLGVEWAYVRTNVELKLWPTPLEYARGDEVSLMLEIPVGRLNPQKLLDAQIALEALR